jgi:hypothetical protein|tara:strand:+ start:346 stop:771 length:426 start_codon:yes stop_codon:yes gene_type:complete
MKTIERVFEVLNKEKAELKAEKVELGVVQDFNKVASRITSNNKTLNKAAQEFVNELSNFAVLQRKLEDSFLKAEDYAEQIQEDIDLINKIADDIAKTAKELGIKPKDTGIDLNVLKAIDDVEDTINTIKKNSSDAKKILKI